MNKAKYLFPKDYMADPSVHVLKENFIFIHHTTVKVASKKTTTAIISI
jgi:hypothetical protein